MAPVLYAWMGMAKPRTSRPRWICAALVLVTLSALAFSVIAFEGMVLDLSYAQKRFVAYSNAAVVAVALIVFTRQSHPLQPRMVVASAMVMGLWLYVAFASSIV